MATYICKGKLFFGKGDEFVPIADVIAPDVEALAEWPTVGEITISGTFHMDKDDRRNLLVWWLMFSALATASRILD